MTEAGERSEREHKKGKRKRKSSQVNVTRKIENIEEEKWTKGKREGKVLTAGDGGR